MFHYFHHPFWGKIPYFWKHPKKPKTPGHQASHQNWSIEKPGLDATAAGTCKGATCSPVEGWSRGINSKPGMGHVWTVCSQRTIPINWRCALQRAMYFARDTNFDHYNQYSYWLIAAKMSSSICKDKPILPNPRKMLPLRSNRFLQISPSYSFSLARFTCCSTWGLVGVTRFCFPVTLEHARSNLLMISKVESHFCPPCPYDGNVLFLKLSKKMMTPNGWFEELRFFLRAILGVNNSGSPMDKWSPTKWYKMIQNA